LLILVVTFRLHLGEPAKDWFTVLSLTVK
jgi:hypothetical protein